MKPSWRFFIVLTICTVIAGCAQIALKQKERQMERVARDWTMTIRASQVIPVYPLSQDIQVGDVYLVNRTVAAQSKRYRRRGFMPTDLLITRLDVGDFGPFYRAREHGTSGELLVLPGAWRNAEAQQGPWERFPKAGFPSYTFNVSNSGGLSVAVPVSSVPVGLSVTGAAEASGSITITDAVTYGMDASTVYTSLMNASKQGLLDYAVPPEGDVWYLRVITRVFAAKSFNVVLNVASTRGGEADAGTGRSASGAESGLSVAQINEQLKSAQPGGSLEATFADERAIGFKETFREPIIVGYHGFDVAIDPQGNIGPIIPTFQVLEDKVAPPLATGLTDQDSAYLAMLDLLRKLTSTNDNESRVEEVFRRAASRGGFADNYARAAAQRSADPVGAWIEITAPDARTAEARSRLMKLLSEAVRELGLGE